jgi:selenocysteine-specific elongation factor
MPREDVRAAVGGDAVSPAVFEAVVAALESEHGVRSSPAGLALGSHEVLLDAGQQRARDRLLERFRNAGMAPPNVDRALEELDDVPPGQREEVLFLLLREGELARVREDLVVHAPTLAAFIDSLRECFPVGTRFSVPEFKEWAGITRKHAIPLLEYLDERRVTRREGDSRVVVGATAP